MRRQLPHSKKSGTGAVLVREFPPHDPLSSPFVSTAIPRDPFSRGGRHNNGQLGPADALCAAWPSVVTDGFATPGIIETVDAVVKPVFGSGFLVDHTKECWQRCLITRGFEGPYRVAEIIQNIDFMYQKSNWTFRTNVRILDTSADTVPTKLCY